MEHGTEKITGRSYVGAELKSAALALMHRVKMEGGVPTAPPKLVFGLANRMDLVSCQHFRARLNLSLTILMQVGFRSKSLATGTERTDQPTEEPVCGTTGQRRDWPLLRGRLSAEY